MRSPFHPFLLGLAIAAVQTAAAASFEVQQPSIDKWMYPFSTSGGSQGAIQTFGVIGNPDFDNRDGQMFLRFDTTEIAAPGLGASNYQLTSLVLTLTLSSDGTLYDPSYDSYTTCLPDGADADAGRPIEVFGVGYRNGVKPGEWTEDSAFGGSGKSARTAYAAEFDSSGRLADVSNNVDQGFDVTPWAIGSVAGAAAGDALDMDTEMAFGFNLSDADIFAYIQAGLNQGFLDLMVTSLYSASQPGTGGPRSNFPVFYSKENIDQPFDFLAGRLSGDLTVVPEPGTLALLAAGAAGIFARRHLRRRHE